jgi:hypothetical protein
MICANDHGRSSSVPSAKKLRPAARRRTPPSPSQMRRVFSSSNRRAVLLSSHRSLAGWSRMGGYTSRRRTMSMRARISWRRAIRSLRMRWATRGSWRRLSRLVGTRKESGIVQRSVRYNHDGMRCNWQRNGVEAAFVYHNRSIRYGRQFHAKT